MQTHDTPEDSGATYTTPTRLGWARYERNKVHSNPLRLIRDWGEGGWLGAYILPKNDHQNDKTLGRA